MTTLREDVLLQIPEVRFKKGDGTIYIMNERIAWMVNNRSVVSVSHKFQDIKMQKISPEGKSKIQLQVVLHDGNSSTFHFVNKNGQQEQMADRDKVKELILQILPNFKRKVDQELENKNKLLTENPKLLQMYKDLVISQVVTSEEFWKIHSKELTLKGIATKQDIGVSGAFLADIKPVADGCNGFKYNLTSDIIDCIFKTYPAVKKKHKENVPNKLTESEFWTKFFQSHYFHRDRITAGFKDIFSECGKIDDHALKAAIKNNLGDPLLDLGSFGDNTIEDGFCSSATNAKVLNSAVCGNIVFQSIIKRFNHHSFMVLNTCDEKASKAETEIVDKLERKGIESNNTTISKKHKLSHAEKIAIDQIVIPVSDEVLHQQQVIKKQKIHEKIQFEDLCDHSIANDGSSTDVVKNNTLNLSKLERYLYGPVPSTSNVEHDEDYYYEQELDFVDPSVRQHIERSWSKRTSHKQLVSASNAVNALGELSAGGVLMRGIEHSLSQFVPPDVERDIRHLYISSGELLKQFWSSFPPTTVEQEEKANKMHESLQRFNATKIKPFEDRVIRLFAPLGNQMISHLNILIQAAFRKFVTWQERTKRKILCPKNNMKNPLPEK